MSIKVSVIVPSYNHAEFLGDRLRSVYGQDYKNFEVILLDDCSSDNSVEILETYSSHPNTKTMLVNKRNSGSTFRQWDKGIQMAEGDVVWIAESDDLATPDFLSKLVVAFENASVVVAYCKSMLLDRFGVIIGPDTWGKEECPAKWNRNYLTSGQEEIDRYLVYKNTLVNASGILFRRDAYLQLGLDDAPVDLVKDWLIWGHMLAKGSVYYCSEQLNMFRVHEGTVRSLGNYEKELKRLKENVFVKNELRKLVSSGTQIDHRKYFWLVKMWAAKADIQLLGKRTYLFPPFRGLMLWRFYVCVLGRLWLMFLTRFTQDKHGA
ncbi:MAG: glycosyltransferase family 2 protein [Flavobacteriales bacterium]|nr:glycosyltransferase family 2 protein [Flavobacteriales bacterium]